MKNIDRLLEIIKKLRAPDGCPWDRAQTHDSIRGHLLEEAAEFLDAVDAKNYENMKEELGDILMHVMLHAEMASEEGKFNFDDVAGELADKLVRRHPHVFSGVKVKDADDVVEIWSAVKAKEKKSRPKSANFWENLPHELSALRKARDVAKHIDKEAESRAASEFNADSPERECGKALYEIVSKFRTLGVEPEGALRDYLKYLREKTEVK